MPKRIATGLALDYLRGTPGAFPPRSGKPAANRCDNGPEYISGALLGWAEKQGVRIDFIQPGNPPQNAYVATDQAASRQTNSDNNVTIAAPALAEERRNRPEPEAGWCWRGPGCRFPAPCPKS